MKLLQYYVRPKFIDYEFTPEGIYKPQAFWRFEKRDFLAYHAIIEEAVFCGWKLGV